MSDEMKYEPSSPSDVLTVNPDAFPDTLGMTPSSPSDVLEVKPTSEDLKAAKKAYKNLYSNRSRAVYQNAYSSFISWQKEKQSTSFSENILLEFFKEKSEIWKTTTLWSQYSMIRNIIMTTNNVDISKYPKLLSFIKKQYKGNVAKKAKVFTAENVNKFFLDAPDIEYLLAKVVAIFAISGICRPDVLKNITTEDITKVGEEFIVNLPKTKNKKKRTFIIESKFYDIITKYFSLRPHNVSTNRFFLKYIGGKCRNQAIGINKFMIIPKIIATFLKLSEADLYTGHSLTRSSATLLEDPDDFPDVIEMEPISPPDVLEMEPISPPGLTDMEPISPPDLTEMEPISPPDLTTMEPISPPVVREVKPTSEDLEAAKETHQNLISNKSRAVYQSSYSSFISWQKEKQSNSFSENTFLEFFKEKSEIWKPTTLWSQYSMIRNIVMTTNKVDISK